MVAARTAGCGLKEGGIIRYLLLLPFVHYLLLLIIIIILLYCHEGEREEETPMRTYGGFSVGNPDGLAENAHSLSAPTYTHGRTAIPSAGG